MADDLIMGEDDFAGDDEVLGAMRRGARVRRQPGVMQPQQQLTGKKVPLGLPSATFTSASGTTLAVEVEPQRSYQAERLIFAILRTGATATGLVRVSSLKIGDIEQLPSSNPVTSELFRADGVDLELDLSMAKGGIKVRVEFQISAAPAAADTVLIDPAFKGRVIGQ